MLMILQMLKIFSIVMITLSMGACVNSKTSLYQEVGGEKKIEEIVNNFVREIEYDQAILPYFSGSNINRFKEKMTEQICNLTAGPCEYTGDSMAQVHSGMNITETDFNRTVELFINAMTESNVPHTTQNKILKKLAVMRKDIIYK